MNKLTARVVFPDGERKAIKEGSIVVIDNVWYRAHLEGEDGETAVIELRPFTTPEKAAALDQMAREIAP